MVQLKLCSSSILFAFTVFTLTTNALHLDSCNSALGMESRAIKDDQISVSSSYDVSVTGPNSARLNVDHLGGAWCPKGMVGTEDKTDHLQIDLQKNHVVSGVSTQGRFGNGRGVEYVEHYLLEYWRVGFTRWKTYKLYNGSKILQGNINTYTAVKRSLMPPVIASKIRFIPYSNHPRTVCMRVELYGCLFKDGLVSYSIPQGQDRGLDVDLVDENYDGIVKNKVLIGGLGQLTDGITGDLNFRANLSRGKGYEWVGWKNDSTLPLSLEFEFNRIRNFTVMYIHTNNMFSKDVQVFSKARVWFGIEPGTFSVQPIEYNYMADDVSEYARNVSIVLKGRIAKFLKVQLFYKSKWIMISEVFFLSYPIRSNMTLMNHSESVLLNGSSAGNLLLDSGSSSSSTGYMHDGTQVITSFPKKGETTLGEGKRQQLIALIIGILIAVILLLMGAIFFIFWKTKKHKMSCLSNDIFHSGPFGQKNEHINNIKIGLNNSTEVTKNGLYAEPFQVAYGGSNYSTNTHRLTTQSLPLSSPDYTECASTDYAVPHQEVDTGTYTPYRSASLGVRAGCNSNTLGVSPKPSSAAHLYSATFMGGKVTPTPQKIPSPRPSMTETLLSIKTNSLRQDITFYGTSQIIKDDCDDSEMSQSDVGTEDSTNPPPSPLPALTEGTPTPFPLEIPRQSITILHQIGEGDFGQVHIGELANEEKTKQLAVVKSLRVEASETVRSGFEREVSILARLQHPNIVRVVGVCTLDDPLCMVSEYCENGDLNQFLQGRVAETASPGATNAKSISYGCLIYMATQIAAGMKYLETLNFVHRDLAARNCLVGLAYSIKISDFGVSNKAYRGDYYLTENKTLMPLRWMAWESVLLGKFTTKSDVWSFAVTLWEVLTMVREHPFEELTDSQVIENITYMYQHGQKKVILPSPPNCPKEIYDLMRECWKKTDTDRPSFNEIHMFLRRKNLGFAPSL